MPSCSPSTTISLGLPFWPSCTRPWVKCFKGALGPQCRAARCGCWCGSMMQSWGSMTALTARLYSSCGFFLLPVSAMQSLGGRQHITQTVVACHMHACKGCMWPAKSWGNIVGMPAIVRGVVWGMVHCRAYSMTSGHSALACTMPAHTSDQVQHSCGYDSC